MLLAEVVAVSREVAATRSRLTKRDALTELLRRTEPEDVEVVVAYLAGELRQRRTGVGWAGLAQLPPPAAEPSLTVAGVDAQFEAIAALAGRGSAAARTEAVAALFGAASADEQRFLRGLVSGDVRQGALEAAMVEAVALAADVPLASVRRAVMLRGATGPVALAALTGGPDAVADFSLTVGQPVRPMLAASAPDVASAFDKVTDGRGGAGAHEGHRGEGVGAGVCVDTKLDGIRIQVHKRGDEVRIFTRSLEEVTERLSDVVAVTARLGARHVILDGEAMTLDATGRPKPFQETASRTARRLAGDDAASDTVTPFFFDVLHLDGEDLIDLPLRDRLERLDATVPSAFVVPRTLTDESDAASGFFEDAVSSGQEGVVVKALDAPYEAGRRGAAWVKVKPRHTLDLVVLAVEWGSGRRQGWLSNIHLGARDPDGGFVMLGKTFKGMTDEVLRWQTERFLELEESRSAHVVTVRPEQVVEIAFDGLQRSTRYPGGLALRFARVVRYRSDKSADEADTILAVRDLAASL
jgi:DNA ligase-1